MGALSLLHRPGRNLGRGSRWAGLGSFQREEEIKTRADVGLIPNALKGKPKVGTRAHTHTRAPLGLSAGLCRMVCLPCRSDGDDSLLSSRSKVSWGGGVQAVGC